ncbi:MAG TPA: NADH-quinone oxidoreductase subunit J [Fimbriimonas sp.]|nr:NADH-quinone oxidoreductase subunit J [Fimbriimonas sp.]
MNDIQITPELILFCGLAGIAALASLGVVLFQNAVRSALCLVLNFFVLAILYFTLNAQMLGITQIVVYTGAIMVLFLFVIMLLNLGSARLLEEKWDIKKPLGAVFGIALATLIGSQMLPGFLSRTHVNPLSDYGTPQALGRTIFTEYAVPFECISVLLLVGIVGSILLAKRKI